jgi:predicted SnoaL-like aldol condensation-catalyzing enzyme
LMGPTYTQHNAHVADGTEGFRQFIAAFKQKYSRIAASCAYSPTVITSSCTSIW